MAEAARTALILNANAKHVTARKARQLAELCDADDVYMSHSLEEAESISRLIVDRGYDRVLSGGGDGTLVQVLNSICALRDAANSHGVYPQMGVLKLGTGNAVASIVGARRPEADLLRLMSEPALPTVPLELIHSPVDGMDFPFAGIGYDGEILNDYNWVKQNMRGPVVNDLMHSVLGYFTALFSRTLPRKLTDKGSPRVRITSRGKAIFRNPADADAKVEIAPGSVLYDGPAAMVSVSTVPFYGFNFRMFPFAQDVPGMMQLRVVGISPLTILNNLPAIWRGDYRNPEVYDFHVEDIVVEGESALPFQIAGDAKGHRDRLEFTMSPRRIDLVSPRDESRN